MKLNEIFLLYSDCLPVKYEIKDTSHGEDDFRQAVIAEWEDQKLVIKITCNDFTTPDRIDCWKDTIEAYRQLGFYCPKIIKNRNGQYSEVKEYDNRRCVIFAEEFSIYKTAEQYGEEVYKPNDWYIYHEDAIRFLGIIGSKKLTTANFPSGICLIETFCPSDPCDEIMETALEFKKTIEEDLPQYQERFEKIWNTFLENRGKLEEVYPQLPTSAFQADLNAGNILLDENRKFVGVLDFNLCGYDTVLNCLFREAFTDFYEDIPWNKENNVFYSKEADEKAFRSFLKNIQIIKQTYSFSEIEKQAAILLYRYLRPFWWQPNYALSLDKADKEKVERILTWIEKEQVREIDFKTIMS